MSNSNGKFGSVTSRYLFSDYTISQCEVRPVVSPIATSGTTLTSTQSGRLFVLNRTSGSVANLPAPSAGLSFQFIVGATAGHSIVAPSACIYGSAGPNVANANTRVKFQPTAGSIRGDTLTFTSVDSTAYYMHGTALTTGTLSFS